MTAENPTGEQYRDADSHTNTRINGPTHARIKAHNRESETLSATIDRALDALERERALPDAVTVAMRDGIDLETAFVAGFMATGEGYNGEYVRSGTPEETATSNFEDWADRRSTEVLRDDG